MEHGIISSTAVVSQKDLKTTVLNCRRLSKKTILTVFVSGNLANDIVKYYRINDYVLIEGYLSIRKSFSQKSLTKEFLQVNVFKIFPLFLKFPNHPRTCSK